MTASGPEGVIRERIQREGPISFADFMDMALYGESGYYGDPPVGERGDFVTGPHVSPLFGGLLAEAITRMWTAMDTEGPPKVIELGAGDGTLAEQLRDALPAMVYAAVEISPGARHALGDRGFEAVQSVDGLPEGLAAVVVANELLDNLPFHRIRRTSSGPVEVRVGFDGEAFVQAEAPCPPALAAASPRLGEGDEAAVSLATLRLVENLAEQLACGYILFIDYARMPDDPSGGVHGYSRHRVLGDVLANPGSTDITAPVDFDAVAMAARAAGLLAHPGITQRDALLALGWRDAVEEQRRRQGEALDDRDGRAALRALDARNRAAMLVDPAGPGALMWMTLSTEGLLHPWADALP